jgi:hypothetical protein
MASNQFIVQPGEKGYLLFTFNNPPHVPLNIDVFRAGTYQRFPVDGRISARITFRHSYLNRNPFDTGINTSVGPITYDIQACFKFPDNGARPWVDNFSYTKRLSQESVYIIEGISESYSEGGDPRRGGGFHIPPFNFNVEVKISS